MLVEHSTEYLERLGEKLRVSGLPDCAVSFLLSWLEDRISRVVVAGAHSPDAALRNSVFQGTVLGSPLWNVYYADARIAVRKFGFIETVFADDFNCWVSFDKNAKELDVVLLLSLCQHHLHEWGRANQVVFDPTKEEFVLIRRFHALGPNFKLLGVTFDPQLLMHKGARVIAVEAGWRLSSLLRPRRFFTTPELMRLYKAHMLSYSESGMSGYFHASATVLDGIDRVQRRFLREMGMTDEDALLHFRLAPLGLRRQIGILGYLHRMNLGLATRQMTELFPLVGRRDARTHFQLRATFHDKQIHDRVHANSTDQFRRSIFGMVECYNALPQRFVDSKTVKRFQGDLQRAVMRRVSEGYDGWRDIFTMGRRYGSFFFVFTTRLRTPHATSPPIHYTS